MKERKLCFYFLFILTCHFTEALFPWWNCGGTNHICLSDHEFFWCYKGFDDLYWPDYNSGVKTCPGACYCSDYDQNPCPVGTPPTSTTTTTSTTPKTTTANITTTTGSTASTTTTTGTTSTTSGTTTTTSGTTTTTTGTTTTTTGTTTTTTGTTTGTTTTPTTTTPATTTPKETTTTTTTVTTPTTTGTTTTGVTRPPYLCIDKSCSYDGEVLPDCTSCKLYFRCCQECGTLVKSHQICPSNTVFDPIKRICTPDLSACTIPELIPPYIQCTCADDNLPDPLSKEYYYSCKAKVDYKLFSRRTPCPENHIFNSTSLMCDIYNPYYVPPDTCGSRKTQGPLRQDKCTPVAQSKVPPMYYTDKCTSEGSFPDANDCKIYYACIWKNCTGTFTKIPLYTDNYIDATTFLCSPNPDKCLCTCDKEFVCPSPGTFIDPLCPSRFYDCIYGPKITYVPERTVCLGGTLFDPILRVCVTKIIPPVTTTTPDIGFTYPDYSSSSSSSSESLSDQKHKKIQHLPSSCESSSSESESSSDDLCPFKENLPCQEEGASYYTCKDGNIYKHKCPSGELFDRGEKCCKPKEKVSDCTTCGKSIVNKLDFEINNVM